MAYVKNVLQPGERVVHEARLHWLIYWRAILLLLIGVALAIGSTVPQDQTVRWVILGTSAFFLLLAILFCLGAFIRRATTEFAVTDHRIIYKSGLLSRHTIEMNRAKVESVNVDQSLMGRLFGYGTILIRGTGGSLEPLPNIEDPLTLRSKLTLG